MTGYRPQIPQQQLLLVGHEYVAANDTFSCMRIKQENCVHNKSVVQLVFSLEVSLQRVYWCFR